MKLVLESVLTGIRAGVFNCHIPTMHATSKRKEDTVKNMCNNLATDDSLPIWVIGGACDLSEDLMKWYCRDYLQPARACIFRSGLNMDLARKADFAVSQGIALTEDVVSWVGFDKQPAVSHAHNMVPVVGII